MIEEKAILHPCSPDDSLHRLTLKMTYLAEEKERVETELNELQLNNKLLRKVN
jgi:hypothetical protein